MAKVVADTVAHFGRLDAVVANAGVTPSPSTIRTMDDADFDRVIGINLTGVYNTVRPPALDHIIKQRGHVVVVSSCAAFAPRRGRIAVHDQQVGDRTVRKGTPCGTRSARRDRRSLLLRHRGHRNDPRHARLRRPRQGDRWTPPPLPLSRRITARQAAKTIVDGMVNRAPPTTIAPPAGWRQYSWLRGIVNPLLDHRMSADRHLQGLLRTLEERER